MKKIAVVFFLFLLTDPLWAKVYGPVRSNETLIDVARKSKPKEATLGQSMIAIYLANPDAFVNGNPHDLKKGSFLTIPEREKFLALSPAQASVALFELNQKYGTPPPSPKKRAPPRKDRLLAQKESVNKATDTPLDNGAEKNGILMPTESQGGTSEAMQQQSNQSNETLPKVEKPELNARIADNKPQLAQPDSFSPDQSLPLPNDQKVDENKSKAAPNAVRSHNKTLAKFAPWVGGASILAFLLIFHLLRRERRPEPWENIDTPEEPPIDALLVKTSKQSLEEEFRTNPDRADLALRLARQYSRFNNVNGLAKLIEIAKTNANLHSILPDLYRLGKLADPEHPVFENKPPIESPVTQAQASLEVKNLPSSEDEPKPQMFDENASKDSADAASDDIVKEESHLLTQEKEITQENRVALQNSAIEGPKEESNRVTQNSGENQEVSFNIHHLKGLTLAKLYLEKGAVKGAKVILEELARSGTSEERKEANLLLSKLIES